MTTSWSLAVALSRFGKWGQLRTVDSGTFFRTHFNANPSFDNTSGLSFLGVPYHSRFITFAGVEGQSNTGAPLVSPDSSQAADFAADDQAHTVPFVDFANKRAAIGAAFSPGVLTGLTHGQIARGLDTGSTAAARDIDALANLFTAAICKADGGKPSKVCRSKAARAGGKRLAAG